MKGHLMHHYSYSMSLSREFPMAGRAEPPPTATPPTEEHHVRDEL